MTGDVPLIDTNILVYAYDSSIKTKNDVCSRLVTECWKRKRILAVSVQNLSEFYTVITRKVANPVDGGVAAEIVKRMSSFPNWLVLEFNEEAVGDAMEIAALYNVHYWDALLIATMRKHGISTIYTENVRDFGKVPFLKVMNPLGKLK